MSEELPKWRCHKVVRADKISDIETSANQEASFLRLASGITVSVPYSYMQKHDPQVCGYYVRYSDGYESFSPADPFEEGYTPICESCHALARLPRT